MKEQNLNAGDTLNGFTIERVESIPELRSQAIILKHIKNGANVIHLYNEDPNNLFCIAFRTPVYNNTGVPHILEHSVLSGSKKFPLKDPFKELLKGSLQTFLNAMTYPDKTIYPVSSQVETDFFNLMDVYCDAVFNPLLTETTFYQEGWHYDVEKEGNPITIKGIVYNEMKGVFSDFRNHVERKTLSALFPDTTYFYESGGDPEYIPELKWDDFKDFHKKFYHPSNSFTFLYGNLPTEKTTKFLNNNYLSNYDKLNIDSTIKKQTMWKKTKTVEITAPASKEDDGTASVILSWIFGDSTDPVNSLLGKIFSHYLLGTENSPLKRALIDSNLGEDLDDISGFDGDLVQGVFAVGLRKCKPQNAHKIESIIMDTLSGQVNNGIDAELLEGVIRQIEFSLKEISEGGHFPYNLTLADRCYRSWMYNGDPLTHLKFEHPLNIIKQHKKEGTDFFKQQINNLFVKNTHRVLSIIKASSKMGEELGLQTKIQTEKLTADFTHDDYDKYLKLTQKLQKEQKTPASPEVLATLPKLHKKDLPKENEKVSTKIEIISDIKYHTHSIFTSGIAYLDISFEMSVLDEEELLYLPLFSELITRSGAGNFDYKQMASRVSLHTGGINTSSITSVDASKQNNIINRLFIHGKCLINKYPDMLNIFKDILTSPHLNDQKLIKDILVEMRNDMFASATQSGHIYSSLMAGSKLSESKFINEITGGITQLRFIDKLLKSDDMNNVVNMMEKLKNLLINSTSAEICITSDNPQDLIPATKQLINELPSNKIHTKKLNFIENIQNNLIGVEITSSVNYASVAWKLNNLTPEEYGQLLLLARNLSTGYLWDKIRVEGGAYGGMSFVTPSHPVFSCASYRDPNISKTLYNFNAGISEIVNGISEDELDQSIIGTIGKLDAPRSPHSKGLGESIALICGRTVEYRQKMRDGILNATPKSISLIAKKILDEKTFVTTVFGSMDAFKLAQDDGINLNIEKLL